MSDEPKKDSKSRREKSVYNPPGRQKRVAKKKKPDPFKKIMCEICDKEIIFLEEADEVLGGYAHHDCRLDDYKRKKRAATLARRIADVDSTLLE